jgi:hypothetical protein
MSAKLAVTICLSLLFQVAGCTQNVLLVEKNGRRIQRDGFLMEWKEEEARPFGEGLLWSWQAMNTSEGLAGYLKGPAGGRCAPVVFFFCLPAQRDPLFSISMDTVSERGPLYSIAPLPGGNGAAAEWVIPWGSWGTESGGFELTVTGINRCADTLGTFTLSGNAPAARFTPHSKRLFIQAALIAALASLFFWLRARAKRQIRRTESPRR